MDMFQRLIEILSSRGKYKYFYIIIAMDYVINNCITRPSVWFREINENIAFTLCIDLKRL